MEKKKDQNYNDSFSGFLDAYSSSDAVRNNPAFDAEFEQLKSLQTQLTDSITEAAATLSSNNEIINCTGYLDNVFTKHGKDKIAVVFEYGNIYKRFLDSSKKISSDKIIGPINKRIVQTYLNLADLSRNKSLAKVAIDISRNYKSLL